MEPSLSVPLPFNKKNFALISPNFPNSSDPKKPKFDIPNLALLNLNTQPSPDKTSHLDLLSNTSGTMAHNIPSFSTYHFLSNNDTVEFSMEIDSNLSCRTKFFTIIRTENSAPILRKRNSTSVIITEINENDKQALFHPTSSNDTIHQSMIQLQPTSITFNNPSNSSSDDYNDPEGS